MPIASAVFRSAVSWLDSTRFDINARMAAGARSDDVFPMLSSLLAERFVLKAHTESREQPITRW
jgi:uncharacterized protein (TIGR03435 family)